MASFSFLNQYKSGPSKSQFHELLTGKKIERTREALSPDNQGLKENKAF